jgi:hypothetical protein
VSTELNEENKNNNNALRTYAISVCFNSTTGKNNEILSSLYGSYMYYLLDSRLVKLPEFVRGNEIDRFPFSDAALTLVVLLNKFLLLL